MKSNRRSFDSAEVRFAQDDRWFGGGGDFARLCRVDLFSVGVGCVVARLKSCPDIEHSRVLVRKATAGPSTPLKCAPLRMTVFGVGRDFRDFVAWVDFLLGWVALLARLKPRPFKATTYSSALARLCRVG